MIIDFSAPTALDIPRGPVVVVGSGAAGIPLSLELADRGLDVVMLESGGDVQGSAPTGESDGLNKGEVDGQRFTGLELGRRRLLGGTSQLWKGQCMRLPEEAFQERRWVPNSGWPISAADLGEPYAEAERWLNVSGGAYDERRWQEFPNLPPIPWNHDRLRSTFTEISRHPFLGTFYRKRMEKHSRLWVILNATAAMLRMSEGLLRGVEVRALNGRRMSIDAGTVVLAAGTVENARILQLSDPEGVGLGEGRRHTGRYFQDHAIIRTAEVVPRDHRVLQDRYVALQRRGRRLWPKLALSPEAEEQERLLSAAATFKHEYDLPNFEAVRGLARGLRNRRLPKSSLSDVLRAAPAAPALVRALGRRYVKGVGDIGSRPAHVWLEVWLEQAPLERRRVTLATTTDVLGLRQAKISWSCEPAELETSRQLTRYISEDLTRLGIARVDELPAMKDDAAWLATVRDGFHPAGTTRMSTTPATGVVDRNMQVHGVAGLYAVGGSVFPSSGYANPTLTIVALAVRLARHIHAQASAHSVTVRDT